MTISPATLEQLGGKPAVRARQILEAYTGTVDLDEHEKHLDLTIASVDCDRNTEAEVARDLRLRTDTDWD